MPTTPVFNAVASPATLPAGNCNGIAWNGDSQSIIVAHATTPFTTGYTKLYITNNSIIKGGEI